MEKPSLKQIFFHTSIKFSYNQSKNICNNPQLLQIQTHILTQTFIIKRKNGGLQAKQEWRSSLSSGRSFLRGQNKRLLWWSRSTTPHQTSTQWLFHSICWCFFQYQTIFYSRIHTLSKPWEWSPREGTHFLLHFLFILTYFSALHKHFCNSKLFSKNKKLKIKNICVCRESNPGLLLGRQLS